MTWTPEHIREFRKSLGLTQEQFAHELGLTTPSINRWECGHALPSKLACRALDTLEAMRAMA